LFRTGIFLPHVFSIVRRGATFTLFFGHLYLSTLSFQIFKPGCGLFLVQ
jgi:hypothetical protein